MVYKNNFHTSSETRTILLWPLIVILGIVIFDQISKLLVIQYIPHFSNSNDVIRITDDFLWLIHVQNKGAAFSFGKDLQNIWRVMVLYVLPLLLILYMLSVVIYSQWDIPVRWFAAGVVGGGIGNMIDRFIRPDGVVDFISVKFYGLFGMERWPTFNLADSSIVVSMICWALFILFFSKKHTQKSLQTTSDTSSKSYPKH